MGDERRWAARYQFLDELWRGRDRIVCDRELEAALHDGSALGGSLAQLVGGLLPIESNQSNEAEERVWVALHNDRRAASFARVRAGTVFVGLDEAVEIAADEPWQIALVHLSAGDDSRGEPTRTQLVGPLEPTLEVLAERLEDDPERSVVLSLACGADEDRSYELLAELVEGLFGDGRIYGLTRPSMAAFYEFGPVLAAAEDHQSSGEPDIEVDNTLGSESPRFEAFLAVIGAGVPGEGVTFIELPAPARHGVGVLADLGDEDLGGLRVQLSEAKRRGDLEAIERQALLEKLEHAEDRIASLEEQLELLDLDVDRAGESSTSSSPGGARLDELMVREQALRWELERTRGDAERLESRPVEELEAEVANLRAELARTQSDLEAAHADLDEIDEMALEADSSATDGTSIVVEEVPPTPAQVREWQRARVTLDVLLRKLERGGQLSALELHRELASLKRLL